MKVIVDRAALNEALNATGVIIATRTPKPILQCVRLTAEKDCLTITAYDQEVGLRYRVTEVEVDKPGETLVQAEKLASIVRESSDETLSIEMKEDLLHVKGRDSHFQIFGQNVREFPPVPDFEGDADFRINLDLLVTAINRTMFAAARESTRYAINGVLWERKGKKLQLVATDGRRLAYTSLPLEKGSAGDGSVIVPLKTLTLLTRVKHAPDDVVEIKTLPNQIMMKAARATISSVLVEGHFPKYEDVIPKDTDRTAEMETAEFLSAVRRAALLTSEESRGIRLAFSGDSLVLSSRVPEQGEAVVNTTVKMNGPGVEIGFNPVFLMDALKVCGEKVTLDMKDATKPGVLKSGPDFLYVVMPVSLS